MEQSRIEESVSVSSSSVDIFVFSSQSLGLTLFFLSCSPHTCYLRTLYTTTLLLRLAL